METLAPPLTGILAILFLGTSILFLGWVGILLIVAGIGIVVDESSKKTATMT